MCCYTCALSLPMIIMDWYCIYKHFQIKLTSRDKHCICYNFLIHVSWSWSHRIWCINLPSANSFAAIKILHQYISRYQTNKCILARELSQGAACRWQSRIRCNSSLCNALYCLVLIFCSLFIRDNQNAFTPYRRSENQKQ